MTSTDGRKAAPTAASRRIPQWPDRSPTRVTRRRPETRARLLEAATAVFAERGFGQTSVEQITTAAGFSRGAFYSNFASTEELFFTLYEQRAAEIAAQVGRALATASRSPTELVDRVVTALTVDRQWILIRTDFLLHAARNPSVAAALADHQEALRQILAPHLTAAIELEALPSALRNPVDLARAVITIHDGAMLQLLLDPDQLSLRRRLQDLLNALLDRRGGSGPTPSPVSPDRR